MTDLQSVLRKELARAIEDERQRFLATPSGLPVYAYDVEDGEDVVTTDLAWLDVDLQDAQRALLRRDTNSLDEWMDEMLAKYSLPQSARAELAIGMLRVRVQKLEALRGFIAHGAVPPISLEVPAPLVPHEKPLVPLGPLFSAIAPGYVDLMSEGWKKQTLAQNTTTYRMFQEHCGDRPVQEYSRSVVATFFDLLRGLPSLYSKKPEWRGMTPAEIVVSTRGLDVARMEMKTMKRHFAALGGLFDYLKRRGEYHGENPAHGFQFPMKGRSNQKRQMWSGDKLAALFASPLFVGCKSEARRSVPGSLVIKDEKYWLPLLGVYHGNRLEEFAQLFRSDVRKDADTGIWYFDINDEADKQVKNDQSKRRVPVHPALVELGFLNYVTVAAPSESDPVFPNLVPAGPDGKRGYTFTKWWTRYRQQIDIYEKGLDYHSFRHGVTTKLYEAQVSEAVIDELTGHEGEGTSRTVYKKAMSLGVLSEAISKVDWPEIVLSRGNIAKICQAI